MNNTTPKEILVSESPITSLRDTVLVRTGICCHFIQSMCKDVDIRSVIQRSTRTTGNDISNEQRSVLSGKTAVPLFALKSRYQYRVLYKANSRTMSCRDKRTRINLSNSRFNGLSESSPYPEPFNSRKLDSKPL